MAGGLRIKQIADYDGINSGPINLRTYQYTLPGSSASSGWLDFQPVYTYQLDIETLIGGQNLPPYLYALNAYLTSSAVSNYPLATTQGSVVGYSHVEELIGGSGQNGMNEYFYTNSQSNPDLGQTSGINFPFAPAAIVDWRRGQLLKETNWKQTEPGIYAKVHEKASLYTQNYGNTYIAVKAGFNPKPANYSESTSYYSNPLAGEYGRIVLSEYSGVTDFTSLASDTTRVYDMANPANIVQTVNTYQYDPATYQLNWLQTVNSKNENITQTITYPNNYAVPANPVGSAAGLLNLQNMGISAYPVEEVTTKSNAADGSNLRTVKAVLTTYKAGQPYRDSVYVMRSVTPVTGFVASSVKVSQVIKDSHYQPVVSFDQYDANGNILQERKVADAPHCYIWSYYNSVNIPTYPVAEVVNASSADIAYTNFESYPVSGTGSGNWVYSNAGSTVDATAPMGSLCYTVSSANTIVKTGLTAATTYVISFWAKTGAAVTVTGGTVAGVATGNAKSGWLYYEYSVTGTTSVTIGGSGLIDELRLYPVNALMTTYTYTPLVGMASKCDTKNDITYYNFDNVGRLSSVMDQNRNILKDYQYNYVLQGPIWVNSGAPQCVQSGGANTGQQTQQQQDTNPYSPTYGSFQTVTTTNLTACPIPPPPVYVKLVLTGTYTSGDTFNTYAAESFSDQACTVPYNVPTNLTVNYIVTTTTKTNGVVTGTVPCNYTAVILAGTNSISTGAIDITGCISCTNGGGQQQAPPPTNGGGTTCSSTVALTTGAGYTPEY